MLKHLFDIAFSFIGLLFLAPLFLVIAILIKCEDEGPVFYRGVRVGRNGKPFRIFKFRTMVMDAEKLGGPSTADDDPRITKIGKLIRKYKLDELPQLINVLKGEMSFVEPRPERPEFMEELAREIPFYRVRHAVKPGMAGWGLVRQENRDTEAVPKLQNVTLNSF